MARMKTSLNRLRKEQEEKRKINGNFRRKIIATTVGLVLSATLATGLIYREPIGVYVSANILDNISFEDARHYPQYRQKFLDSIVKGAEIPYCDGVVYDDKGSKITTFYANIMSMNSKKERNMAEVIGHSVANMEQGDYDLRTPDIFNLAGENRHTKIFVGRKVFETRMFSDSEELKSSILDHEARHVVQYAKWFNFMPREKILDALDHNQFDAKLLYDLCEYDATAHELDSISKNNRNLSPSYINGRKRVFIETGFNLISQSRYLPQLEQDFVMEMHKSISDKFPILRDVSISR